MPYDLGAKVNRLEWLKWLTDGDENAIAEKLHEALSTGQVAAAQPLPSSKAAALSADGSAAQATDQLPARSPHSMFRGSRALTRRAVQSASSRRSTWRARKTKRPSKGLSKRVARY